MKSSNMPPNDKPKRVWPIVLLIFCFILSASAGAFLASGFSSSSGGETKKTPVTPAERENFETELIKVKDKTTVLIMGVDVRKDDVGRSDTMMIATVDPKYDQASLLSVPRDTRVRIPGYGYDKVNAAYAYGGEPLAEKTAENLLGIDIDHYVIINTRSFVKIIDAIGGIDIDVEKRMRYEDPWDDDGGLFINLYPGLQHMDGKTAVTYVRYRDGDGDIGRIKRQQKFMEACLDKVTSPEIIPRIPAILREVLDAVETDMTFKQLLELAGALKSAQQNGLTADMVPGYPLYIDEISYWIPNVQELRFMMAEGLGVSVDSTLKRRAEKAESEYRDSIPSDAGEIPEGADNIGTSQSSRRNSSTKNNSSSRESSSGRDNETSTRRNYDDDEEETSSRHENSSTRNNSSTGRENSATRNDSSTTGRNSSTQNNSSTTNRNSTSRDNETSTRRQTYDDTENYSPPRRNYDEDSNYERRSTTSTEREDYNSRSTYEENYSERNNSRELFDGGNYEFDVPERDGTVRTR